MNIKFTFLKCFFILSIFFLAVEPLLFFIVSYKEYNFSKIATLPSSILIEFFTTYFIKSFIISAVVAYLQTFYVYATLILEGIGYKRLFKKVFYTWSEVKEVQQKKFLGFQYFCVVTYNNKKKYLPFSCTNKEELLSFIKTLNKQNIFLKIKKKKTSVIKQASLIIIALIIMSFLLSLIGTFKNTKEIIFGTYQIELPSHWKYIDGNNSQYLLSGDQINHKKFIALITPTLNWSENNIKYLLQNKYTTINEEQKQFNDVNGTMYLCQNKTKMRMYFFPADNSFLLIAMDYYLDKQSVIRYEELLNAIQKINAQ